MILEECFHRPKDIRTEMLSLMKEKGRRHILLLWQIRTLLDACEEERRPSGENNSTPLYGLDRRMAE